MPSSWFFVVRFIHIMNTFYLHEKANVLEAAVLMWYFFILFYHFHRFPCNQVAVNFDPTVVLVRFGNIVEKLLYRFNGI